MARRSCRTLGPSEVSSVLCEKENRVIVLIASATSKSVVRSALRARNANRDSGARQAVRPSTASGRTANFGAASHAASGSTPARHAGLSVLRRPAGERTETRRKSQCTSAFALGNGTWGAVQLPQPSQQRICLVKKTSSSSVRIVRVKPLEPISRRHVPWPNPSIERTF